ncbi:multidrug efflux SMR transporter (plasmid) [Paenibacillus urinalis]|uniref:DMT family transporter n=1 Tax=Paenibacillus urinalis TaxID=521520 RepID=UPI002368DCCE|nr:multidrug efflux SMR transporter [Paenibacillus urinalis]WDH95243.1 multidrug efflux SMR transporter [Paenibacillus urinalis]
MKGYIFLGIAIIAEVFGTTMLKMSHGFTNLLPTIGLIVGMGIAFYSLTMCLRNIPLSTAYAVWAGVGTAITAIIGVVIWNDPFNILSCIGLVSVIGGVVLLNLSKGQGKQTEGSH